MIGIALMYFGEDLPVFIPSYLFLRREKSHHTNAESNAGLSSTSILAVVHTSGWYDWKQSSLVASPTGR
jgi:hypothetical protein